MSLGQEVHHQLIERATCLRSAMGAASDRGGYGSKERPPNTDLQRAPLLEAQAEIEIAAGDTGRARSAADELELVAARFESKALIAGAALARGRVQLADGDAVGAEQSLSESVRLWNEVGDSPDRRAPSPSRRASQPYDPHRHVLRLLSRPSRTCRLGILT